MCKKSIPIIIGLSVVVAMLVLGYATFVKLELGEPIQEPEVNNNTADTTLTPDNISTPIPAPDDDNSEIDTSNWLTYRNEKYGYEIKYPDDWRIATEYMRTIEDISSDPKNTSTENDFIVITKLSLTEEKEFLEFAEKERGIALSPYFNFGLGKTITMLPVYGNKEDLYKEINDSITIKSSNIRDIVLSGITITRYRRYEATDNGVFDYESALIPYNNINNLASYYNDKKYNYIEIRIERNSGNFEENIFNQMLSTIKFTDNDETAKTYILDCTNEPEKFQSKYSWYNYFKEQIIENWSLETVCHNDELNKVAYLKSKIDWGNYVYDSNRASYGLSQLGIYDTEKDTYDKAPEKNLGFYEGCGIIKEWNKNNEIIYQCGAGDAGVGTTSIFSYNIVDKTVRLIEECNIQAGREPEEICNKK